VNQTIFALSSGAGRAGIAVIRISGPQSGVTLEALAGRLPPPRLATLARLRDPGDGSPLDDALILWFPAPQSFTGEDVVELHVHGGTAVVAAVLDVLGRQNGLGMAEPGDFTRRAFLSGKLDLTGAEGLIDLIDAQTQAQRRQALRQSDGRLGRLYDGWRDRLIALLAHFEAAIDFPDEELPDRLEETVRTGILGIEKELTQHLDDKQRGERLRDGIHIAILGPPNVGKSSLLNLLSRRDAAIVSAQAGTTRDVVEVRLDLGGYPVVLADTAGLRESTDAIEVEGVRRARMHAGISDLKLVVFDGACEDPHNMDTSIMDLIDGDTIVIFNKIDLLSGANQSVPSSLGVGALATCRISVRTGQGVEQFLDVLRDAVGDRMGQATAPVITRARHREAVRSCSDALNRALNAGESALAAEDLRLAVRALGRITGSVDVEDLLDVIFRDFCIGK
jgi:tRNA modification GTPase